MRKKKNIAFICSSLDGMAGGIERQIIRTCNSLLEKNYNVILITYDNENAKPFFHLPDNLIWLKCGNGLTPNQGAPLIKRLKQIYLIRQILKKYCITDLVTFHHGLFPRSFLASLFLNIKKVVSERNSLNQYNFIKLRKSNLGFISLYFADVITVQIDKYKNEYPLLMRKKIITIPNIIKKPLQENISPNFDSNVISMLGRLSYQKNFDLLLKQTYNYKTDEKFEIRIAGDGPLMNKFKKRYENKMKNVNIKFFGNVSDVDKFLMDSALFCFPSLWEGYPNALVEALRIGLPIITTYRMEQLNEFVEDNVNGLIVKDENLLETCIELLNDKKRLNYMGLMSKNKFLKLSSKDPIKLWQKLF